MKRRSEQTLETLKSTSNDDKERKSNINNFKFERCDNKLGNMNNLLCIYETEKKHDFERIYRLYFVFSSHRKIPEGTCGTHIMHYSLIWELEIFRIIKYGVIRCKTIEIPSKQLDVITFTDYSRKHFLACIFRKTRRYVTIFNLDDYQLNTQLSDKYHHENFFLELRKTENDGVTKFLIALTSDNMIKIWCTLEKKLLYEVRIDYWYKMPLEVYEIKYKWEIIIAHTGKFDEKLLRLQNLEKKTITTLSNDIDSGAMMKIFQNNSYEEFLATSGIKDHSIKIWNLQENILSGTLIGHQDIISALEFFCNDKKMFLASASLDKKIKIWDLNSYTMKNSFEVKSKVYDLICSKSNNALSIYSLHDNREIVV